MPFTPKDWRNLPDQTTPLNASAIEGIETRLSDYTDQRETAVRTDLNAVEASLDGRLDELDADLNTVETSLNTAEASLDGRLDIVEAQNPSRGKSVIAAEHSRTNVAYGKMGSTPGVDADQVSGIVLPTNGQIHISFQALWKESVDAAARAAIFIGLNQLKIARTGTPGGPVTQAAAMTSGGSTAGVYVPLASGSMGLGSHNTSGTSASLSDVTTGQVVGMAPVDTFGAVYEVGSTLLTYASRVPVAGEVVVFAAAGTYDISIQFKSSSGSVTVKERKLWVWSMGF